jgi:HSP20 family molecular chaperone IbpA
MSSEAPAKQSGRALNIAVVSANDQTARMQGAIARRAFSRCGGSVPGHELEDWRQAESELVSSLCHGLLTRDEDLWVGTDVAEFKQGTIEIWVSPRHLTICGESGSGQREKESGSAQDEKLVFRTLHLPVDVEPAAVTAKLNGSSLEICIPKAYQERCQIKASTA